jgi:hypothetical protein
MGSEKAGKNGKRNAGPVGNSTRNLFRIGENGEYRFQLFEMEMESFYDYLKIPFFLNRIGVGIQ